MTAHTTPTKVVVIGGGYSGTLAANQLRLRGDVDITLVNPRPKFVERIRLHQLMAGTHDATVDYGTLIGKAVRLVVDTATRIDTAARAVELASGRVLEYDYVIYAVGSTGAVPAAVPGAAEFAFPVAEFEQAKRARAALDGVHRDAPVTVVGGGLTGIEVATELAEQGRRVTLVCGGRLGPSLSEPGRRSVAKVMAKLQIAVLEADVVTEVRPDSVVLADGAIRPSALTIWTAGFGVPDLAAGSGLRTDAMGRLLTDETLTSISDARIVAAGDCASPSGDPLRMCCATASQLGPQAANTVLSRIAGVRPAALDYGLTGNSCTSLGRRGGILQFGRSDNTQINAYLGGRIGATLKEAICKGTVWALRRQARKPGSAYWFKGAPRPAQPMFEVATRT